MLSTRLVRASEASIHSEIVTPAMAAAPTAAAAGQPSNEIKVPAPTVVAAAAAVFFIALTVLAPPCARCGAVGGGAAVRRSLAGLRAPIEFVAEVAQVR